MADSMVSKNSEAATPTRVLFVDDERFVLDAIRRTLRGGFECTFAEGGQAALDLLDQILDPFDVICTDMRMPSVDGLDVLSAFRERSPATVRILLTGQADLESAAAAINEGGVFRFLLKPTNPDSLRSTIADAAELGRLRHAEQELLELTLRGSVNALLETLSLANPLAFARGQRIRSLVMKLAGSTALAQQWELEVAAMLSQVGAVTLPPQVSERLHRGLPLDRDDAAMVDELPALADHLLAGIPRLDTVREIIRSQHISLSSNAPLGTKLLLLASELDTLTERGLSEDVIAASIKEHEDLYGVDAVAAFTALAAIVATESSSQVVQLVRVAKIKIGMILAADVKTRDGLLLVGRGQEVSESLLARIQNFSRTTGLETDELSVYLPLGPLPDDEPS